MTSRYTLALAGGCVALMGAVFGLSWTLAGPIAAVLYTFLLVVGAGFMPAFILLVGPSFPGSMRSIFGKLQWVLAAVAYDVPFLVEHEHGWELHVGRKRTDTNGRGRYDVYINDSWQTIEGGEDNMTVLGWRPFGIIRNKHEDTWEAVRADSVAETNRSETAVGDGGQTTVSRGGYEARTPPPVDGVDGEWLVDLTRVYSVGLQMIGDIAVIERAEEIMTRSEAQDSAVNGYEPIIATAIGLILGVGTAWAMYGA